LKQVDGANVAPMFHGRANAELAQRSLYFHYPHHRNSAMHSAIVQGDHKLFRFYERPESSYLYNLNSNLGETKNLSAEEPEVVARLQQEMDRYFASIEACLPKPNPVSVPNYTPFDPDMPEEDAHATESDEPATQPETELTERQLERQKRRELRKAEKNKS
jgi:hypothetical protein